MRSDRMRSDRRDEIRAQYRNRDEEYSVLKVVKEVAIRSTEGIVAV